MVRGTATPVLTLVLALAAGASGCAGSPSSAASGGGAASVRPASRQPPVAGTPRGTGDATADPTPGGGRRCRTGDDAGGDVEFLEGPPFEQRLCLAAGESVTVRLAAPRVGDWADPRTDGDAIRLIGASALPDRGLRFTVEGVRPGRATVTTATRLPPGVGAPSHSWVLTVVVR